MSEHPDLLEAATCLLAVSDEFERRRSLGVARAIEQLSGAGGKSDADLRKEGEAALRDLRAAVAKATLSTPTAETPKTGAGAAS